MVLEITNENVDSVLSGEELIIIDFWAEWCGPCRVLGPTIDNLSEANHDKDGVKIAKVNVDENPELAMKYGIRGIPAVLFIKNGEVVERMVGVQPQSAYQEKIDIIKG